MKKFIRDLCVFAVHNVVKDPPFANIHLVACRNMLIYLEPFLQKKVFDIFHYALNNKGILFLGKSETAGNVSDLFAPFAKQSKFYIKKPLQRRFSNIAGRLSKTAFDHQQYLLPNKEGKTDNIQKATDELILSRYSLVGVVVNEHFDIVQFRGLTGDYLEPSPGKASLNLLKMAREGLAFELRNALHKANSSGEPFKKEDILMANNKRVAIEAIPILNLIDLHFLVLFKEQPTATRPLLPANEKQTDEKAGKDEYAFHIQQLDKELLQARDNMRSITEDQEIAYEELQSSNEELLSGSEELQSLNEELETSKEELESTNEELITINQELFDRNTELNDARNFTESIITVLHEPILVLDKNNIIKVANDSFFKIFRVTKKEVIGKILFDVQKGWNVPALHKHLKKIHSAKEKLIEAEINFRFPGIGNRTLGINMQPLLTENGEPLILLALDDVTLRKNAEKILEDKAVTVLKERQWLQAILMEAPALIAIVKGPTHIFEFTNTAYQQFTGNDALIGKTIKEAMPELESQGFLQLLDAVYETGNSYAGKEIPVFLKTGNPATQHSFFNFHYQTIKNGQGSIDGILIFATEVTELVAGRKYLERNAEMIQNLYLNAPAYVCTFRGPQHVYDLVNPSYQKLFGSRQIAGKPIMKALPELEGQGFDKILDNVYRTGETYVGKEILIWLAYDEGLEPAERYFNFSYQPIYDENKIITGILVFGYEVTEQMLAKKGGQEDAERFRLLADAMPQKMWTADELGHVNYLNTQWLEYTHKSFDDLKGFGWEKIIHPDDLTQYKQTWANAVNTGASFQLEHRFLSHDGHYYWHLSRALSQKDKLGKVMVWIGTHTDIDEQKKIAEKIRMAEEFSRSVLQSNPDCVKVLDKDGLIYFMNTNGLCQMEIDDFAIVKNMPWRQLWGEENKPLVDAALAKALAGETALFQAYRLTANGTPKWWDVVVSPVFSPDGSVTQLISVSRDITDRIKLEQKKDEFIGIASHEMKTPLTTAKAYMQLLELSLGEGNEKASLYAQKASVSIERLNTLITELLDVSKIQNGKLNYTISHFNFDELITNTVEDMQQTSPLHTLIKTGEVHSKIRGDKDRLQQVIINLLSNAIKYSPQATKVFIHVAEKEDTIIVSVKDEGFGISKPNLDKIFDRYYRVADHAVQFQGLGIGLYISHEIIERHHGRLWAESEPGKGSTFYFTLPLNPAEKI